MMDTQRDDEIDIEGASENQGLINKTKSQAQEVSKSITDKLGSISGDVQKTVESKTGDLN